MNYIEQLIVGLLLGGRAFAVAGETPGPPLVSFGPFRVWFGGRIFPLLSACVYISIRRKCVLNSEAHLTARYA